jgi:hypothetical protein
MAFEMWLTDLICAIKKSIGSGLADCRKLTTKENKDNLQSQYLF